jgi:hypothetical protein
MVAIQPVLRCGAVTGFLFLMLVQARALFEQKDNGTV